MDISGQNTNGVSMLGGLLGRSAGKTGPMLCLEVNPPHGVNVAEALEKYVGQVAHLDFFNVTDSPLARMKLSALPFAAIIKSQLGVEPLVNISCRDRNIMALQADLLAGWATGVRGVVALTGDAMSVGDCPTLKGVFEINSVGLLGLISKINSGSDFADKPLNGAPSFTPGVVLNPNAKNSNAELRRLEKKVAAGAKFALTQPIFEAAGNRAFLKSASDMGIPVLVGLLPFKTAKAAISVIGQVPGIKIPESLLATLKADPEKDWSDFFIEQCTRLAHEITDVVAGFHIVSGTTPKLALKLSQHLAESFR